MTINKTSKYLSTTLRYYSDDVVEAINSLKIEKMGVFDTETNVDYNEKVIYIFVKNASTIYDIPEKVLNICLDTYNSQTIHDMMLVVKIPEIMYNAYDNFIKGNYSKMFTKEQLEDLYPDFKNKKYFVTSELKKKRIYDVYTKNFKSKVFEDFVKNVNNIFNTDIDIECFKNKKVEIELPLIAKEEIFNHIEESDNNVFISSKEDKIWLKKKRKVKYI